ncbi:MAG: hypothetical protein ABSA75_02320 [Candidatus Bathyarchaeia archaeon]
MKIRNRTKAIGIVALILALGLSVVYAATPIASYTITMTATVPSSPSMTLTIGGTLIPSGTSTFPWGTLTPSCNYFISNKTFAIQNTGNVAISTVTFGMTSTTFPYESQLVLSDQSGNILDTIPLHSISSGNPISFPLAAGQTFNGYIALEIPLSASPNGYSCSCSVTFN